MPHNLETPEGRLRTELALANLQEFLPTSAGGASSRALDLGCGTGTAAVRLARLGIHVTVLDSSPAMLELAERTVVEAAVSDKVTVKHGDAATRQTFFRLDRSTSFFAIAFWNMSTTRVPYCSALCA